jgi:hypothetical protein
MAARALLIGTILWTPFARGGDGRDFQSGQSTPATPATLRARPAVATHGTPTGATPRAAAQQSRSDGGMNGGDGGNSSSNRGGGTWRPRSDTPYSNYRQPRLGLDLRDLDDTGIVPQQDILAPQVLTAWAEPGWGESINSYPRPAIKTNPVPQRPAEVVRAPATQPVVVKPVDPATAAARALEMARNYVAAERPDVARQKLKRIIESYPDTSAAKDAQAMLQELPTR